MQKGADAVEAASETGFPEEVSDANAGCKSWPDEKTICSGPWVTNRRNAPFLFSTQKE